MKRIPLALVLFFSLFLLAPSRGEEDHSPWKKAQNCLNQISDTNSLSDRQRRKFNQLLHSLSQREKDKMVPNLILLLSSSKKSVKLFAYRSLREVTHMDLGPSPLPWAQWRSHYQKLLAKKGDQKTVLEVLRHPKYGGRTLKLALKWIEKERKTAFIGLILHRWKGSSSQEKSWMGRTLEKITGERPSSLDTYDFFKKWWKRKNKILLLPWEVKILVAQLDSPRSETRRRAYRTLKVMGKIILPLLDKELSQTTSQQYRLLSQLITELKD